MVAHYFKSYKPRSKIIVVDAKNKFSKQKLFEDGWARYFPGMVEWLPLDITGGVKAVDAASNTIITEDEKFQASVANVVPPQKAGAIAQEAGLADESGWCPIVPETLASRQVPDVHLVGDAIIPGDMPKSGFSANTATCPSPDSRRTAKPRSAPRRFWPSWPTNRPSSLASGTLAGA
jgi:NADPH-dependent 2,4-dienoyl-CoA reductase/sulfur reductase-like enzyme